MPNPARLLHSCALTLESPTPCAPRSYVLRSFVLINNFMTTQQFLDGIAVVNFVPTPLVMFVTWRVAVTSTSLLLAIRL